MEDQGLHYWYFNHFVNLWIRYFFAGFVFSDCDGRPTNVPPLPVFEALCGEGEHSSTNHLQLLRPCRGADQRLLGQIFLEFLDGKLRLNLGHTYPDMYKVASQNHRLWQFWGGSIPLSVRHKHNSCLLFTAMIHLLKDHVNNWILQNVNIWMLR